MGGTIQATNASVTKTLATVTTSLPNATVGIPYSTKLAISGGVPPIAYALTSGAFSTGLVLTSSGLNAGTIAGTPLNAETDSLTITATDHVGYVATFPSLSLKVNAAVALAFSTASPLPNARIGTAYSTTFVTTGGTAPVTFAVTSGAIVSGLTLSSAGVLSGTPTAAETDSFTVKATDSLGATVSKTYALTTTNSTTSAHVAALPLADHTIANWNALTAYVKGVGGTLPTDWPVSYQGHDFPFTDPSSGVVMRRCANAVNVVDVANPSAAQSDTSIGMLYASSGPLISRPFGTNLDTYHVCISNANTLDANYWFDYQLGVGPLPGTFHTFPLAGADSLPVAFSMNASDSAHICYLSNKGGSTISRYDTLARAYAPNAAWAGANASVTVANRPGWLQTNWSGTHLVTMTPFDTVTSVNSTDIATGVTTTHAPSGINEPKIQKGTTKILTYCATSGRKFWFITPNILTAQESGGSTQTHSNAGETNYYIFDSNTVQFEMQVITPGAVPGAEGGAWTGANTNVYAAGGNDVTFDGDFHPCMSWDQTGSGGHEYFCITTAYAAPGGTTKVAPGTWTLSSGSIYTTSVTFGSPAYGSSTRGVTGVIIVSGSNYIGNLNPAASVAAMTAGTFFWSGSVLSAWMPDSTTPSGKVHLRAQAVLAEAAGYCRADGGERRRLTFTWRNDTSTDISTQLGYYRDVYGNWSPDGKLFIWNSNLGLNAGPIYPIAVEVPVA